jgi:hypothetical protein
MLIRVSGTLLVLAMALAAADMTGTWKLNTGKSKYVGMPKPKEMTVVYAPVGSGWKYEAKGVSTEGQPLGLSFVYVRDGEEIKLADSLLGDTLVLKNAHSDVGTGVFKRGGKVVGQVKRVLSKGGNVMTLEGTTTLTDGSRASYTSVYEKQ